MLSALSRVFSSFVAQRLLEGDYATALRWIVDSVPVVLRYRTWVFPISFESHWFFAVVDPRSGLIRSGSLHFRHFFCCLVPLDFLPFVTHCVFLFVCLFVYLFVCLFVCCYFCFRSLFHGCLHLNLFHRTLKAANNTIYFVNRFIDSMLSSSMDRYEKCASVIAAFSAQLFMLQSANVEPTTAWTFSVDEIWPQQVVAQHSCSDIFRLMWVSRKTPTTVVCTHVLISEAWCWTVSPLHTGRRTCHFGGAAWRVNSYSRLFLNRFLTVCFFLFRNKAFVRLLLILPFRRTDITNPLFFGQPAG